MKSEKKVIIYEKGKEIGVGELNEELYIILMMNFFFRFTEVIRHKGMSFK